MSQASDIVGGARVRLVRSMVPYLSDIIMNLRPFECKAVPIMGVDDRSRMAFHPDAILKFTPKDVAVFVFHESLHIVLRHLERKGHRHKMLWNIACDCECNRVIDEAGFGWPSGFKPVTFASIGLPNTLTAEEAYDILAAKAQQAAAERSKNSQKNGNKEGEDSGGSGLGSSDDDESDSDGDSDKRASGRSRKSDDEDGDDEDYDGGVSKELESTGDEDEESGSSGSSSESDKSKGEDEQSNGNGGLSEALDDLAKEINGEHDDIPGCGGACGEVIGNPQGWEKDVTDDTVQGSDDAQTEILRKVVAQKMVEHQRSAPGSVPGSLATWAGAELTPPKIPWQRVLGSYIRSQILRAAGMTDFTRSKVSRRWYAMRKAYGESTPMLPSMCSYEPKVVVEVDTSGSMFGERQVKAVSETVGIVKSCGYPVIMIAVDCAVQACAQISGVQAVEKLIKGGGGTDMGVGIAKAMEFKPDVIVVITDGETGWPSTPPPCKVVVCITNDNAEASKRMAAMCPQWARVVVADD